MALPTAQPTPLDVAGRRVGVLGAARSGVGYARLLTAAGAQVVVGDSKVAEELDAGHIAQMTTSGAEVKLGLTELEQFGPLDLLVLSPGVPLTAPVVRQAQEAGLQVTGEIEIAHGFCRAPVIAVTGTNGKGSACTLTGAMLNEGGLDARVCGNIGDPFTGAVAEEHAPDLYVVEVSSFQLETVERFRPWVATILNITPDHLDRHRTFEAYVAAKARLLENQTSADWAILNADDQGAMQAAEESASRPVRFSATRAHTEARVEGDTLVVDIGAGPRGICHTGDLVRAGRPYIETVLASASMALIAGASPQGILSAIRAHTLPPHVIVEICEAGGVRFIDSSKATNPAAAEADIESVSGPLVVIAGGLDKRVDFASFARTLDSRATGVFVIGECAEQIAEAISVPPVTRCASLEEAVRGAYAAARRWDTVMLAPACASWDMFPSYKVRGELFREVALQIAAEERDAR